MRVHGDRPDLLVVEEGRHAAPGHSPVVAPCQADVGAGEDGARVLRVDRKTADGGVELDVLVQGDPCPRRAVIVAAQHALSGRGHEDCSVHVCLSLVGGSARGRCRGSGRRRSPATRR